MCDCKNPEPPSKQILHIPYPVAVKERIFSLAHATMTIADKTGFIIVHRTKGSYRPQAADFTYDLPDGSYLMGFQVYENHKLTEGQ